MNKQLQLRKIEQKNQLHDFLSPWKNHFCFVIFKPIFKSYAKQIKGKQNYLCIQTKL